MNFCKHADVMLFSIIVPVYNVELYLEECLESILKQSFRDFELIIVDDGSTDSSGEICDLYKQKDSRVKVYHKTNEGLLSAWRFGLSHSMGDFVGSIDSDDYIEYDLLEKISNIIKEYNCDMYVYGYKSVDQKMGTKKEYKIRVSGGYYTQEEIHDKIFPELINKGAFENRSNIYLSRINKFVRRTLMLRNSSFYNLNINFGEDNLWTIPNVFTAESMYIFQNYYPYNYRYNPQSISRSVNYDLWNKFKKLDNHLLDVCTKLEKEDMKVQIYRDAVFHAAVAINNIIMEETKSSQKIKRIRNVISDENVRRGIGEMDMHSCSFKEKINLFLIKRKMTKILYCIKVLQKR